MDYLVFQTNGPIKTRQEFQMPRNPDFFVPQNPGSGSGLNCASNLSLKAYKWSLE
jgi:hypothetical protein